LPKDPRTSRLSRVQVSFEIRKSYFDIGVMALLRPLLLDNVPSIQQSAALALGRLANYSDELAEAVVSNEILPQLVYSLSEQNVSYKISNFENMKLLFLTTILIFIF
jgi:hypothetical protein